MRFTVRSLGGKLIISAALTLLLCMLLFSAGSWLSLKFYYEHTATSVASRHLSALRKAYQDQVNLLKAAQHIDDRFASELAQAASNRLHIDELNVALCESKDVKGTTMHNIAAHIPENDLCSPGALNVIDDYLTLSTGRLQIPNHLSGSPSLVIVDIEPLYIFNAGTTKRAILILIGLGIFIIAFGVTVYALVARTFFIGPIRRLQARISALVAANANTELTGTTIDELSMLARSFSLLSESLYTQENESNVITRQMSDLLAMSDVLISTLNLEDLLGEIVSRLGRIMRVKSVSLLLYGREMQSPWAVAQWSDSQLSNGHVASNSSQQYGAVTVHTDPDGDITMAVTSKMAAITAPVSRSIQP